MLRFAACLEHTTKLSSDSPPRNNLWSHTISGCRGTVVTVLDCDVVAVEVCDVVAVVAQAWQPRGQYSKIATKPNVPLQPIVGIKNVEHSGGSYSPSCLGPVRILRLLPGASGKHLITLVVVAEVVTDVVSVEVSVDVPVAVALVVAEVETVVDADVLTLVVAELDSVVVPEWEGVDVAEVVTDEVKRIK